MTAWRRPDAFPNSHRLYLGQSGLAAAPSVRDRMEHADFILAIGTQFGQLSTFRYKTLQQDTAIVHVSGYAEGLGGPFPGVKSILSDPHHFLTQLLDAAQREDPDPGLVKARREQNDAARKRWLAESTPAASGSHRGYCRPEVLAYHLRWRPSRLMRSLRMMRAASPHGSVAISHATTRERIWLLRQVRWVCHPGGVGREAREALSPGDRDRRRRRVDDDRG